MAKVSRVFDDGSVLSEMGGNAALIRHRYGPKEDEAAKPKQQEAEIFLMTIF